jgi:hypothetical protein
MLTRRLMFETNHACEDKSDCFSGMDCDLSFPERQWLRFALYDA